MFCFLSSSLPNGGDLLKHMFLRILESELWWPPNVHILDTNQSLLYSFNDSLYIQLHHAFKVHISYMFTL